VSLLYRGKLPHASEALYISTSPFKAGQGFLFVRRCIKNFEKGNRYQTRNKVKKRKQKRAR
jgi:hypothetical protein